MTDLLTQETDRLLARFRALKPQVDPIPRDSEMPDDLLREALSLSQQMDRLIDQHPEATDALEEARAWFHASNLPTAWRPTVRG